MSHINLKVKLVDGAKVRAKHIDFVAGGHHLRYKWIPSGQVWIEKNLKGCDREATILHEVVEIREMRNGLSYEAAHRVANSFERRYRKNYCSGSKIKT